MPLCVVAWFNHIGISQEWCTQHMMTSSNGNFFRVTVLLCGEFKSPMHSTHKSQWRGALMSSLICAWTITFKFTNIIQGCFIGTWTIIKYKFPQPKCVWVNISVRGPSYLGLTRSISWLLIPGSLRRQDISRQDIDKVKYVGPGFTWERILSTCVISMWSNDIKCKYMFHVPPEKFSM